MFYNSLVRPCTQEERKAEGSPDSVEHCQLAQELEADDETGELLALVKEALKYEELYAEGKVNEITVDKHWPLDSFYHRVYFEE